MVKRNVKIKVLMNSNVWMKVATGNSNYGGICINPCENNNSKKK